MAYRNYIKEYHAAMCDGSIIVSQKIRKLYTKLVDDIDNPKGNWVYDEVKANKPIEFIEKFVRISKGAKAGQTVKLILWEFAFIQSIMGFVDRDTGFRKYSQVFLLCSRKNGKSYIAIGLMLFCLLEEMGAQCIAAANTLQQAQKVIFEEVQNIVKQNPLLSKRIKKRKNDLYYEDGLSTIFAVTNSPLTQDGLNASFCLFDECHSQKTRELYDVIYQSMSSRDQPIMLAASTNGFIREGCFDMLYEYHSKVIDETYVDESCIGFFYELDDPKEIDDEANWIKCNPSLGEIKKWSFIRGIYEQSKNDPSIKPTCYTKDFNLPWDNNLSTSRYLEFATIKACHRDFGLSDFKGNYCCLGLDLSLTTDLSCLTGLMQRKGSDTLYIWQDFWLPEGTFEAHCKENATYKIWFENGWLNLCKGDRIDLNDIEAAVDGYMNTHNICPIDIGFDRYGSQYLIPNLKSKGYKVTPVGQGYSISNPMKILQNLFVQKKIVFNNPITAWCLSNTCIGIDKHENWSPIKLKAAQRIDGTSSLLDAMYVYEQQKQNFLNLIK